MNNITKIIKRLESLKTALELDDEDVIEIHTLKLKKENDKFLDEIVSMVEQKLPDEQIVSKIDDYIYGFKDSDLTLHQKEIFDEIVKEFDEILSNFNPSKEYMPSENFVSLSGFAGVGKTFVTSKLVKKFLSKGYKILLTTPTHKALSVARYMLNAQDVRINLRTLHSYLDIKLETNYLDGTKSWRRARDEKQLDFEKNLDILIVDESSMINNELFGFIEENLAQNRLKSVLFIGDSYQLPPVSDDKETNAVTTLPKQYKLTQIVRQAKNSHIKQIAIKLKDCIQQQNYIPINEILDSVKHIGHKEIEIFYEQQDFISSFTKNDNWWKEDKIVTSWTNDVVDEFNRAIRFKYWIDKENLPPKEAIIKGDLLIFNEPYKRSFLNSEAVEVIEADKHYDEDMQLYYFIAKDKLGRVFKVIEPNDMSKYINYLQNLANEAKKIDKFGQKAKKRRALWRKYFALKEEFADLKYIFSSTIHKLQGSTYDVVYIDAASIIGLSTNIEKRDFAYRLLYVAVTRARKEIKLLM